MGLVLVFAKRAQRLAKLQIDFVAGVSHELRTPLTVICSAGDNLADGIVPDSSRSTRMYGELIRGEGRKLASMIEQILQFAGMRAGRRQYNLQPACINDIALKALEQSKPAIAKAGFSVHTNFDPDLPMVNVDPAALLQAVQNLIQNALKYSGDGRWLAVRTEKTRSKTRTEVRLAVEDRGMGIESQDLQRIFEPFYRGEAAVAGQIHGTGLGLFMVREALTSMGGSISVKSARGKGSAFTLHLPGLPGLENPRTPNKNEGNS
jgi:signal transduction histidine kinase